jgi:ribosomal protein L2
VAPEVGASIASGAARGWQYIANCNIPVGSIVHCIELQIGKGAQIVSPGTSATVIREGIYAQVCVLVRFQDPHRMPRYFSCVANEDSLRRRVAGAR